MVDINYHKSFKKYLIEKSESNDFMIAKTEWHYVGCVDTENNDSYCICGHNIRYEHYYINKFNGNEIIVGSKCIHQISEEDYKKAMIEKDKIINNNNYCNICDTKKRKVNNEDFHYCKNCDERLEIGKYKNKLYVYVYNKDKNYCQWVLNKKNAYGSLKDFQDYLIEINRE